jgi:hypothetical protein
MADVYENAFLTIAATHGHNGSAGYYSITEPRSIGSRMTGYENLHIREIFPSYPDTLSLFTYKANQRAEEPWLLLTRGWAYREMRLSTRVVHHCNQEVIWECRTNQKSERGSDQNFEATADQDMRSWHYFTPPHLRLRENPSLLWYQTVTEYSQRKLTFEKDKMPALARLAQRMQKLRNGDRYLLDVGRVRFSKTCSGRYLGLRMMISFSGRNRATC